MASIRLPNKVLLDYNDSGNVGATSVVSKTFSIPQDAGGILVKVPVVSVVGTAGTVNIYAQTSDDGGTTWYDLANIVPPETVVASTLVVTNAKALWANIPTIGTGIRAASVIVGNASVRGTANNCQTGLPIIGTLGRIQIAYGGTIATNNGVQVQVMANTQTSNFS